MDALRSDDAGIRRRAAAALRTIGAVNAIPALKQALDRERDPETRSNIVATLAALELEKDRTGDEAKIDQARVAEVETLIQQLSHTQPEKVIAAALKLGEMHDKRAVEPLIVLFNNAAVAVNVRLAIAEALIKLESAPVEVALLKALRSPNWRVRRNGAAILGQVRADWAVPPLISALKDENETVRQTARAALKHINSPEARAALTNLEKTQIRKTDTLRIPKPTSPLPHPAPKVEPPASTTDAGEFPSVSTAPSAPSVSSPQPKPTDLRTDGIDPSHDAPTQPQRPASLLWPKRTAEEADQSKIPTRPLDPKRLEEAQARLNQSTQITQSPANVPAPTTSPAPPPPALVKTAEPTALVPPTTAAPTPPVTPTPSTPATSSPAPDAPPVTTPASPDAEQTQGN